MKSRFPYRKWLNGSGDFCGSQVEQMADGRIRLNQSRFALGMRPLKLRKASADEPATASEIRALRGLIGSGLWISKETRPDLAVMVTEAQMSLPCPRQADLWAANHIVRRAKQFHDLSITFHPIPPAELTVCIHSDSSLNVTNLKRPTVGGAMVGFTNRKLNSGEVAAWSPAVWRSFKQKQVVTSTLTAEARALSFALGRAEWLLAMMHECLFPNSFDLVKRKGMFAESGAIAVTDAKSLYDSIIAPGAPSGMEDSRCAFEVLVIRQSLRRMGAVLRWAPGDRQLADCLTKNDARPADLIRALLKVGKYQISDESFVLDQLSKERVRRQELGKSRAEIAAKASAALA